MRVMPVGPFNPTLLAVTALTSGRKLRLRRGRQTSGTYCNGVSGQNLANRFLRFQRLTEGERNFYDTGARLDDT